MRQEPNGVLAFAQGALMQTVAQRAYVMHKGRMVVAIDRDELLDTERVAGFLALSKGRVG